MTQSNERTVDFVSMVEKVLLLVGSHILREKYLTSNPYRLHPLPDHSLQVTAGHFGSTRCKPAVCNCGPMLAVNGLGRKKLVKCNEEHEDIHDRWAGRAWLQMALQSRGEYRTGEEYRSKGGAGSYQLE